MKFIIHYDINGYHDSIIIEGKNLKELQETVKKELSNRGKHDYVGCWSEKVED